jgi:hypothetical protein
MKTLCLATLLLVGYSSLAQIKSFDDLRGIDSEEAFIRVCLENGYQIAMHNYLQDHADLYYGYDWEDGINRERFSANDGAIYDYKDTVTVSYHKEWTSQGKTHPADTIVIEYQKGRWNFNEKNLDAKRKNGNSYYDKILAEVKSECTLFEIKDEALIYECPQEGYFTDGVKFKGKIKFKIYSNEGEIEHFFPD